MSGEGVDFDGFFVDQYPRLFAIGLAWSIDRETAADLAQEAMARALSDWGRVSCLASPGGWTARVMTNLLIDAHRARRRRERVSLRPVMDGRLVPVGITDDDWRAALRGLPERQRLAVVLYYVADMEIVDVAAAMGVAVGTVKAMLSQARSALRDVIGEEVAP